MAKRYTWLVATTLCALPIIATAKPAEINLTTLLREMVSRETSARLPDPAYTCKQLSSYDRRSVAPDKPGWFANNDWSQFLRDEQRDGRKEHVMFDADGPGSVVRFWTGGPTPETGLTGMVRFYFDGEDKPAIEEHLATLCGGEGQVKPPLSAVRCIGRNLYLPIPYAKHCKITYQGDENCWYNIEYRTYPASARVRTFSWDQYKQAEELIRATGDTLLSPQYTGLPSRIMAPAHAVLATDQALQQQMKGGGAISSLSIRVQAKDMASALRCTVLSISFDGEQTVWCPLGDFYGSGVGLNPYRDWYREVDRNGLMTCYWTMPYAKSCQIEIRNLGQQPVDVTLARIGISKWRWDKRSMHFHATWRQQANMDTKRQDGFDWNYLEAQGQGVYMGDNLALFNGDGPWWGEGDEKIFVDGEAFPSHFGTGSEDYYGYSYGDRGVFFEAPFHAESRWEGNNKPGFVCVTRSRDLDAIPFDKSLKFDMEVWHWSQTKVSYAATTYWYARPGATCNRAPMTEEVVRPLEELDSRTSRQIEGEALRVVDKTGGEVEAQSVDGRWSGGQQLWWRDGKPGDKLVLELPATRPGRYTLSMQACRAFDYGIQQLYLDGDKLGDPIDLYSRDNVLGIISLGEHELTAGKHKLTVEIVGANPAAAKRYMFGLDFVRLEMK